jgi:hypothetical protein
VETIALTALQIAVASDTDNKVDRELMRILAELERISRKHANLTARAALLVRERDRLIRRATQLGASRRAVAPRPGVANPRVQQIVERDADQRLR